MTEIVYRGESNQPLTNSKLVAEVFGKEHRNVVRDIKNLIEGGVLKNEHTPMFEETAYINEQNKQSYNKPSNSTGMIDPEIKEQLDRIEQYSLIAAKNVLNINEAAIILGMTVRGVRENVRNRIIPCYKPNVNRLYFKKSELEEWMTQNRRKSVAELKSEAAAYCFTH